MCLSQSLSSFECQCIILSGMHPGKERYRCRNTECKRCTFILNYTYKGYLPEVKEKIAEMAMNGSGIRDTARVLRISPSTVISELKKKSLV